MPNHKELLQFLSQQDASLSSIYTSMSKELAVILKRYKLNDNSQLWHRNKQIKKEVDVVLGKYRRVLYNHISQNTTDAWNMAEKHNDNFVSNYIKGVTVPNPSLYFKRNTEALQAFLKRQSNGIDLSKRVWNITKQTQSQLEYFIADGLTQGRSATDLAGDLKRYLKEPEKRFRRLRNPKTGKLMLSDPAKDYKPGTGVYRSSYKNALRLARNEINIAYRSADMERRKNLDFVVGIKVNLSPAHPQYDICDELQGEYPKEFNFVGWHPNCLCFTTSKLLTKQEFINHLNGKGIPKSKYVNSIPDRATKYINSNADRIKGFSNTPYFIQDNFKNTKDGFELKNGVSSINSTLKNNNEFVFKKASSFDEIKNRLKDVGFERVEINGVTIDQANMYLNGIESEFFGLKNKPSMKMLEIFRNPKEKYNGVYSYTSNIMRFNAEYGFNSIENKVISFEDSLEKLKGARLSRMNSIDFYKSKNDKKYKKDISQNEFMLSKIEREIKDLETKISKGEKAKPFSLNASYKNQLDKIKSTVHHEFGHYWDDVYSIKSKINPNTIDYSLAPSQYAQSSFEEYIAETYSNYRMKNETNGVPKELIEIFKKIR